MNDTIIHSLPPLDLTTACCTALGPKDFFNKAMNTGKDALVNTLSSWKKAITHFSMQHFTCYDALVGENACHIRAFALLDIFQKKQSSHDFQETLDDISSALTTCIIKLISIDIEKSDTKKSVREFLNKHNLLFTLPQKHLFHVKYIIDSHLLTITKEKLPTIGLTLREKTSYKPIREWGYAYNRAQYLVHNTQKVLSALSCEYIKSESEHLPHTGLKHMLQIKKDSHGRSFIPQFFTAKVLFLRALQNKCPLLLKVTRHNNLEAIDTMTVPLVVNKNGSNFTVSKTPLDKNTPVIMLEGVIDYSSTPETLDTYKERLFSQSILDVFLANFAIHPQYSGDLKHLPPPFEEAHASLDDNCDYALKMEQKDFEYHKKYAIEKGCSLEQPNLLFINHMYFDVAGNHEQLAPSVEHVSNAAFSIQNTIAATTQ